MGMELLCAIFQPWFPAGLALMVNRVDEGAFINPCCHARVAHSGAVHASGPLSLTVNARTRGKSPRPAVDLHPRTSPARALRTAIAQRALETASSDGRVGPRRRADGVTWAVGSQVRPGGRGMTARLAWESPGLAVSAQKVAGPTAFGRRKTFCSPAPSRMF